MKNYIVLILSLCCFQSYAQDLKTGKDSNDNKNIVLQLEDSLKTVNKTKKTLETENEKLQGNIKQKQEQLRSKKEQLSKKEDTRSSSGLVELENNKQKVEADIKQHMADTAKLKGEIKAIAEEISRLQQQKSELETIKDDISEEILKKNEPYLDLRLSDISKDRLAEIKAECSGYTVDSKINAFVARVESIEKYKQIYEKAKQVVSTSFKKADVQNSLAAIASISNLNESQQQEINVVKGQLELFETGALTFKEFIVKINATRDRVSTYTPIDFQDDLMYFLKGLEEKIDKYIMNVPYLKLEYSKFMEIMKANPMEHPAIEQEMLNL